MTILTYALIPIAIALIAHNILPEPYPTHAITYAKFEDGYDSTNPLFVQLTKSGSSTGGLTLLPTCFGPESIVEISPKTLKSRANHFKSPSDYYFYLLCASGTISLVTVDGVSLTHQISTYPIAELKGGRADRLTRPLGGALSMFESDDLNDVMYIATINLGLVRVEVPIVSYLQAQSDSERASVAGKVKYSIAADAVDGVRFLYPDDVAVSSQNGWVYLSDASDVDPITSTLEASLLDGIRGKATGRVIVYKPESGKTEYVGTQHLWFANGVAIDTAGTFMLICDTFGAKVWKVILPTGGPETDNSDFEFKFNVFAEGVFPGYLDGISISDSNRVFVAVPSEAPPAVLALASLSPPVDFFIRSILLRLPPLLLISPTMYGCVVELDFKGNVKHVYMDASGEVINFVTSATESPGGERLYLGGLHNNDLGIMNL